MFHFLLTVRLHVEQTYPVHGSAPIGSSNTSSHVRLWNYNKENKWWAQKYDEKKNMVYLVFAIACLMGVNGLTMDSTCALVLRLLLADCIHNSPALFFLHSLALFFLLSFALFKWHILAFIEFHLRNHLSDFSHPHTSD